MVDTNTDYENRILEILDRLPEWVGFTRKSSENPFSSDPICGPAETLSALADRGITRWLDFAKFRASQVEDIITDPVAWDWVHSGMAVRNLSFQVPEIIRYRRSLVHARGGRPKNPSLGGVYFIRAAGFIKIGLAGCIEKRIRDLQIGSAVPLECVGYIETDDTPQAISIERELHDRFEKWRHHGEWFAESDEIRALIAERATPWPYRLSVAS
jgi:hypothetical protein